MSEKRSGDERSSRAEGIDLDHVEASFLAERDWQTFPTDLRITSRSEEAHRRDAVERAARWERGDPVPHVVNFPDPSDLRRLLTDRRLELLRRVMDRRPSSIRSLAEGLGRDVKSVHEDLQVLAAFDIVGFERAGRAKRPFVPYETIEVRIDLDGSDRSADAVAD